MCQELLYIIYTYQLRNNLKGATIIILPTDEETKA